MRRSQIQRRSNRRRGRTVQDFRQREFGAPSLCPSLLSSLDGLLSFCPHSRHWPVGPTRCSPGPQRSVWSKNQRQRLPVLPHGHRYSRKLSVGVIMRNSRRNWSRCLRHQTRFTRLGRLCGSRGDHQALKELEVLLTRLANSCDTDYGIMLVSSQISVLADMDTISQMSRTFY